MVFFLLLTIINDINCVNKNIIGNFVQKLIKKHFLL